MKKDTGKIMLCIVGPTIREIVRQSNELKIKREDIVGMFHLREQFWLVYYG